jgi:hypothetical protein
MMAPAWRERMEKLRSNLSIRKEPEKPADPPPPTAGKTLDDLLTEYEARNQTEKPSPKADKQP